MLNTQTGEDPALVVKMDGNPVLVFDAEDCRVYISMFGDCIVIGVDNERMGSYEVGGVKENYFALATRRTINICVPD